MQQMYAYKVPRPSGHPREGMTESSSAGSTKRQPILGSVKRCFGFVGLSSILRRNCLTKIRKYSRSQPYCEPHTDRNNFLWETGFPAFIIRLWRSANCLGVKWGGGFSSVPGALKHQDANPPNWIKILLLYWRLDSASARRKLVRSSRGTATDLPSSHGRPPPKTCLVSRRFALSG
jgi:hypothetical protein